MAVVKEDKIISVSDYEAQIIVPMIENKIRAWDWAIRQNRGTLNDQEGFKKKLEIAKGFLKKLEA